MAITRAGWVTLGVLTAFAWAAPAAGQFLPYRLMLEAARSPERPMAFVQDKTLRIRLREALVAAEPGDTLSISPYVYGGHGYLVGFVTSKGERTRLIDAARKVEGLISLDVFLPMKPAGASAEKDLELKLAVEKAITLNSKAHRMNVAVQALDGHVVLIGAVGSEEAVQSAGEAARQVPGVDGVTSFLTVPEPGSEKLLRSLLP
jgi:osmotically-inducible protein OsmY